MLPLNFILISNFLNFQCLLVCLVLFVFEKLTKCNWMKREYGSTLKFKDQQPKIDPK